jgi:hypothetical protein
VYHFTANGEQGRPPFAAVMERGPRQTAQSIQQRVKFSPNGDIIPETVRPSTIHEDLELKGKAIGPICTLLL